MTSVGSAVRPPVSIGAAIPACRPWSPRAGSASVLLTVPTLLSIAWLTSIRTTSRACGPTITGGGATALSIVGAVAAAVCRLARAAVAGPVCLGVAVPTTAVFLRGRWPWGRCRNPGRRQFPNRVQVGGSDRLIDPYVTLEAPDPFLLVGLD